LKVCQQQSAGSKIIQCKKKVSLRPLAGFLTDELEFAFFSDFSYVLSRHLKQNETIYPPPPTTPELGKFRGEPVYPRSSVLSLKTAENWMRSEGRKIRMGEPPLKMARVRAGTVNKQREIELVKQAVSDNRQGGGGDDGVMMQGLYARSQTEVYVPDPIIDVSFFLVSLFLCSEWSLSLGNCTQE